MQLPNNLKEAVKAELVQLSTSALEKTHADLSSRYRNAEGNGQPYITSSEQRNAYLAARMPATYAVIYYVLQELKDRMPDLTIASLLDLGAGPGTAMWAAAGIFSDLANITLVEQDSAFITIGKRLANYAVTDALQEAVWQQNDFENIENLAPHDLIICSYSVGELPQKAIATLIEKAWKATKKALVVIEPGTPQGFERMRRIRNQLITYDAYLIAPCPHAQDCPMSDKDWCHFAQRVERSTIHRKIKQGSLCYEDEKFSYLIVSKNPCQSYPARIIRHPQIHSGFVELNLCTIEGDLLTKKISRKEGDLYRFARKASWGQTTNH